MDKKMILISISKVQTFISCADSIRQLYQGSFLISEQIKSWVSILTEAEYQIIIPVLEKPKSLGGEIDAPNYILAFFEGEQEIENEQLEQQLAKILLAGMQLKGVPFFVAAVDYHVQNYRGAYQQVYKKMRAYKNNQLMAYRKVEYIDQGTKNCPLCGQELQSKNGVYCYICQQKTECKTKKPSTSTIASVHWRNKVSGQGPYQEFQKLANDLKREHTDGQQPLEEIYYLDDLLVHREKAPGTIEKMSKYLSELSKYGSPSNYYSVVRMDLDDFGIYMGRENKDLEQHHKITTQQLKEFVKQVNTVLDNVDLGVAGENVRIYSGGDDFLFFLPLKDILQVLPQIREQFDKTFQNNVITYSTSIVIAHRKSSLKDILSIAAAQLKEVKQYYENQGKGGTAISVVFRGSGKISCQLKEDQELKALAALIEGFSKGEISSSIIWSLKERLSFLTGDLDDQGILYEVGINEIMVVCKRKMKQEDRYQSELKELFHSSIRHHSGNAIDMEQFLSCIRIAERWGGEIS